MEVAKVLSLTVLLLWGTPLSLIVSLFSLHQFKILYGLLTNFSQKRYKGDLWRAVKPHLKRIVSTIEATFGPAHEFKPTSTQVIMVAIIMVVLFSTERISWELQARKATSTSRH
ncbi:g7504 [Coccomyxa elongata]